MRRGSAVSLPLRGLDSGEEPSYSRAPYQIEPTLARIMLIDICSMFEDPKLLLENHMTLAILFHPPDSGPNDRQADKL